MLTRRRQVGLLGLAAACVWLAGTAGADVRTERSGSILVFPKVFSDASAGIDTIIQLTNTSNSVVRAHCFYVNAGLTDPSAPPGPDNPRLWQEVDFDILLTRQQPTYWLVSEGRQVNPLDPPCKPGKQDCFNAGFDPGRVPPVVPNFTGELKCIQVDESGAPLNGNSLKGEATIVRDGDIATYSALAILGAEGGANNGDGTLVLGGGQCALDGAICKSDADCGESGPCLQEYNACPGTWILTHLADGAPNPAIPPVGSTESQVFTELTVAPCTEDFETQIPTRVTLQFQTWNEFESQFSVSTTVDCWATFRLEEVGSLALTFDGQDDVPNLPLGTMFLQTRIRSAGGTPVGVLLVAEEQHTDAQLSPNTAWAAANLHIEGERPTPDIIRIPGEQLESPF